MDQFRRALYLVLGDKETIRRSFNCGMVSGFLSTLLVSLYFVFVKYDADLSIIDSWDFNFLEGYLFICIPIAFVLMGGYSIGWLLVRPIAVILFKLLPHWGLLRVWGVSSVLVWTPMVIIVTAPFQYPHRVWRWPLFFLMLVLALAAGGIGGVLGARSPTEIRRGNRDLMFAGGSVTASLLVVLQSVGWSIGPASAIRTPDLSEGILSFWIFIIFYSFFCMIPSVFIALISFLFTRLKLFRQKEITVYIMVSGIIWGGVGISLFSNLVDSFGGTDWIRIIVIVLAGVCGGWVMAQLEHGNSGSITVYEPNEII